ncbi:hypothetical protein Cri9333_4814 (plasmid) [Crinalium epipsammum PCC 9333]|uniref:Uncharacterized protein n=1 Tax=Crinalium epipsammum PCC 9333 TaxID=1173022 RepID=K9W754_9CYAN|nr:hypothetical protein Cri9333_4814 [Crinalium epipsammum PCC 9333]
MRQNSKSDALSCLTSCSFILLIFFLWVVLPLIFLLAYIASMGSLEIGFLVLLEVVGNLGALALWLRLFAPQNNRRY